MPAAGVPLYVMAVVVAYSRVHTGVHYPGDVIGGALLGSVTADLTMALSDALRGRGARDVLDSGPDS
jgi:membrane-associated phospholipid phosphatase